VEEPRRGADGKWTTKSYDFDTRTPIPFPEDLGEMSTNLIKRIPWDRVFGDTSEVGWQTWKDDYRTSPSLPIGRRLIRTGPDSGIVNFYQMRDTLMGHADRAE